MPVEIEEELNGKTNPNEAIFEDTSKYKTSKFYQDIKKCFDMIELNIHSSLAGGTKNRFYSKKLAICFVKHHSPFLPLWTPITNKVISFRSKLFHTNNNVEGFFSVLKTKVIGGSLNVGRRPLKYGRFFRVYRDYVNSLTREYGKKPGDEIPFFKSSAKSYKRKSTLARKSKKSKTEGIFMEESDVCSYGTDSEPDESKGWKKQNALTPSNACTSNKGPCLNRLMDVRLIDSTPTTSKDRKHLISRTIVLSSESEDDDPKVVEEFIGAPLQNFQRSLNLEFLENKLVKGETYYQIIPMEISFYVGNFASLIKKLHGSNTDQLADLSLNDLCILDGCGWLS